jgi:hypothetical protein
MALEVTKSITLQGFSKIDNTIVQTFNASASTEGGTSMITNTVQNQDLYNANKTEMRKDFTDFQQQAWDVQDSVAADTDATAADATVNTETN